MKELILIAARGAHCGGVLLLFLSVFILFNTISHKKISKILTKTFAKIVFV